VSARNVFKHFFHIVIVLGHFYTTILMVAIIDLQDLAVHRALAVNLVLLAHLEILEFQVRAVFKVQLDSLDRLDSLDHPVTEELQEGRDLQEAKVKRDVYAVV